MGLSSLISLTRPQAGLFSAVQSAFAVAMYPALQTSTTKVQVHTAIAINVFVFSSLTLSLTCAFVAILRRDQLRQYLSWTTEPRAAQEKVLDRQFRFEQTTRRKLWVSARQLSEVLILSIFLFAIAVFVLLWTLDRSVALAVLMFAGAALCVIFWGDISHYYFVCRSWVHNSHRFGKLPSAGYVWEFLKPAQAANPDHEAAVLGKATDVVLGILKNRDTLKGSQLIPLSRETRLSSAPLPRWIPEPATEACPWLTWLVPALGELSADGIGLLGNIVASELTHCLQAAKPVRGEVHGDSAESLFSAFWLAYVMDHVLPSGLDIKLRQAVDLASVRLQLTHLLAERGLMAPYHVNGMVFTKWRGCFRYIINLSPTNGLHLMFQDHSCPNDDGEHQN
jgi:hypothetical protein